MDFITDLPCSASGNDAILVLVDKLTKYVHLVPTTKKCSSEELSRLFLTHIFQYHGMPKVLISDRDPRFVSRFWRLFCQRLGCELRFSTAYHPQTDGQTERTNRVVEEVLRHFVNEDHTNWEDALPLVAFAINNAKSSSTGQTPYYLNFGTHPQVPSTVDLPEGSLPTLDTVFQSLEDTLKQAKTLIQSAQDRQKAYADKRRQPHEFKAGMKVMLSARNIKFKKGVKKLHNVYLGPFKISEMIGQNAARLKLPPAYARLHPVFHVSLLKEWKPGIHPEQAPPEPEIKDGEPWYEVEAILAERSRRTSKRKVIKQYLIKWLGYDSSHNSWEPESNLNCDELLAKFKNSDKQEG
jgi:hypothetical protein